MAITTNCVAFTNVVSVIHGGMVVDVAATRGDRGLKHGLGKQLMLSHRPTPPMAAPAAASRTWRSVERSSSRRLQQPAYELPGAAWAALVLARA